MVDAGGAPHLSWHTVILNDLIYNESGFHFPFHISTDNISNISNSLAPYKSPETLLNLSVAILWTSPHSLANEIRPTTRTTTSSILYYSLGQTRTTQAVDLEGAIIMLHDYTYTAFGAEAESGAGTHQIEIVIRKRDFFCRSSITMDMSG